MPHIIGTGGMPINDDGDIIIKGGAPADNGWRVANGEAADVTLGQHSNSNGGTSASGRVVATHVDDTSATMRIEFTPPLPDGTQFIEVVISEATK